MSDNIFPVLRGLTYPITKTPNWHTITQKTVTGKQRFLRCYSYPLYTFKLTFEYLGDQQTQDDDIHTLMGFYNRQGGAAEDFLFADSTDNTVSNQVFGVGDGSTTTFQLVRDYGGFVEPVFGIVMTPTIAINGTSTTAFDWNTHGLITFTTAPASGAQLTWSGTFYYRCHFLNDKSEFENIFNGIWELQELQLESLKG